ncbi:sulfur carrier protein ThiS [Saccharospirillum sp.]|uniref:sulfur carrier protein ThiS n=1 Tax=Saccharospirillum sp. TaxID=2033801 RepID=UPI0034A0AA84
MKILCNGDHLEVASETTLDVALSDYLNSPGAAAQGGLAVACNGEVVPRHQWSHWLLAEGDRLELFTAVAGG